MSNNALDSSTTLIKTLCELNGYSLIETHISWVLLSGQYAYKIKKPVNFGFLDFSTLEQRRHCCHEELRLNQRLAADLYLDVVPITGTVDHPQLGGEGLSLEYAVKMIQFPARHLLAEYAKQGQLTTEELDQLTESIAQFHDSIAHADLDSPYGEGSDINHWFIENFDQIRPLLTDIHQKQQLQHLQDWDKSESHKLAVFMQLRKQQGYIRECHGDLHLGNMTLLNDRVILFDCIEFNPMLRWIDVISEVAFLFIDLLYFGYKQYAYRFLNRYLQNTGDYKGLTLLPYYLVYRALVRAKVTLLRQTQQIDDLAASKQLADDYQTYADLAEYFSKPDLAFLMITHGYSGSGKSIISSQLSERLGAFQLRSDIERKRLFGHAPLVQTESNIDTRIYSAQANIETYLHLKELAKVILEAGFPVIVDACFLKSSQREIFKQLATDCKVPFQIISFEASEGELSRRIDQRQNDASEATVKVLYQQIKSAEPLSGQERNDAIIIDTETDNALDLLMKSLNRYTAKKR